MKITGSALLGVLMPTLAILVTPHAALSQIDNAVAGNNGTVPTPRVCMSRR